MAILSVLLILVLGYIYANKVHYERIKLKRSDGWEAYVYLAKHGLLFLSIAVLIVTAILLILLATDHYLSQFNRTLCLDVTCLLSKFNRTFGLDITYEDISFSGISPTITSITAFIVLISFRTSYTMAKYKINNSNYWDRFKRADGILNIIISSINENKPVKISLKSRKVYVGLVKSEQLNGTDLDNIVIIPLLSGYRDEDKLRISFDCNYNSVYKENDITNLDDFTLVIRMDEMESLSLFDIPYYKKFEFKEIKPQ